MKRITLGLAAILLASTAYAAEPAKVMDTSAGQVYTDMDGMTLYTFDKDEKGTDMSACTGGCIAKWPPFLAEEGAAPEGEWTLVDVVAEDGQTKKMWAYEGQPLYYYVDDKQPGDVTGDGVGGVWHVATPG